MHILGLWEEASVEETHTDTKRVFQPNIERAVMIRTGAQSDIM